MKSKLNNTMEFIYTIMLFISGILIIWSTIAFDMEFYWYLAGAASIFWGIFRLVKFFKNRKTQTPEE